MWIRQTVMHSWQPLIVRVFKSGELIMAVLAVMVAIWGLPLQLMENQMCILRALPQMIQGLPLKTLIRHYLPAAAMYFSPILKQTDTSVGAPILVGIMIREAIMLR